MGILVIAAITFGITVYSGTLWGRWGTSRGLNEAREALKSLPMEIGDWQAEKEGELDNKSITLLRIQDSYLFRTYRHKETQAFVRITLMVGPTGKITAHTPEICFGGKDYKKESARTPVTFGVLSDVGEIADTFWQIDFVGRSLETSNRISFYWAVSAGDVWSAVEKPRSTFQKYRYVYKIQIEAYSGIGDEGDNVKKFLEECLPTIHEHMCPYRVVQGRVSFIMACGQTVCRTWGLAKHPHIMIANTTIKHFQTDDPHHNSMLCVLSVSLYEHTINAT